MEVKGLVMNLNILKNNSVEALGWKWKDRTWEDNNVK